MSMVEERARVAEESRKVAEEANKKRDDLKELLLDVAENYMKFEEEAEVACAAADRKSEGVRKLLSLIEFNSGRVEAMQKALAEQCPPPAIIVEP